MTLPVEPVALPSAIEGVEVVQLPVIADERGAVLQMLKEGDPHFIRFGEIYFSSVYADVIKAWKCHRRITANYACIVGLVKIALYDSRAGSATEGRIMEVLAGPPDRHVLVVIPPGVWHGFQGRSRPVAVLANCATEPNDPSELDRLDPDAEEIPYRW